MGNHRTGRSNKVKSAAYVGRVGALAVALGIGAAVATMPGIARADDTAPSVGADVAKTEDADQVDKTRSGSAADDEGRDTTTTVVTRDSAGTTVFGGEFEDEKDADGDPDVDANDIGAQEVDADELGADDDEINLATADGSAPIVEPIVITSTPTIVELPTAAPPTAEPPTAPLTAATETNDSHKVASQPGC